MFAKEIKIGPNTHRTTIERKPTTFLSDQSQTLWLLYKALKLKRNPSSLWFHSATARLTWLLGLIQWVGNSLSFILPSVLTVICFLLCQFNKLLLTWRIAATLMHYYMNITPRSGFLLNVVSLRLVFGCWTCFG